jgi:para-nitrobenzyl esterase
MVGLHPTKVIIETVTDALPFEPSIQQTIQPFTD